MKAVVFILGLACVGLAFGYYNRNTTAAREVEEALKHHHSLSNQVMQLETKLAMVTGTSSQLQSNLQSTLERRVVQLAATSNRLVQVGLLLTAAQSEKATAQSELQAKAGQLALVERERDEFRLQAATIPSLQNQLADARQKAAKTTSDLDFLFRENRRLQVEKDEATTKLDDVGFLRVQLKMAEENAELQRRRAKAGQRAPVDKKAPLELQPDGTVRPVSTPVAQAN
jgi:regulator of replication initiation timing